MTTPITSEFTKLVDDCMNNLSKKMIYNASIDHARELFVRLLRVAGDRGEDVRISSRDLDADFYNSLCNSIEETIKKGSKVTLAVLNSETQLEGHHFSDLIRANDGAVFQSTTGEMAFPHFIVVNNNRFRLETDHKQTKAVASFNNVQIGGFLKSNFDKIITKTVMRQLPALEV